MKKRNIIRMLNALPDGDDLPTEFRIFKFGTNESSKGPALFDAEAAALVMEAYTQHGTELAFDYEHQILADPPVEAPAAGWFELELRGDGTNEEDGLYAVNIRWTEKAAGYLRAKEYRYFSPAFIKDTKTNRVVNLLNVALTNTPATHGLTPLVAASQVSDFRVASRSQLALNDLVTLIRMAIDRLVNGVTYESWVYVCDVFDDYAVYEREGRFYRVDYVLEGTTVTITSDPVEVVRSYSPVAPASAKEPEMTKLLKALGLTDTATEDEALAALQALLTKAAETAEDEEEKEVLSLTAKSTTSEALGVVRAWKDAAEQVTALSARVASLEGEKLAVEVAALVDAGAKEGKITPALKAWATELGTKDIVQLRSYLAAAPKVVAFGAKHNEPKPEALKGMKWNEMSTMEKHNLYVNEPEVYAALKAQHEAA